MHSRPIGSQPYHYVDFPISQSQGRVFVSVTQTSHSHPQSIPEIYRDSSGNPLPPPNPKLCAFDRTPAYLETTIQGEKIQAYVFQSGWNGHQCQIEVINGPDYLKNRVTQVHKGEKFGIAKRKCTMELDKLVSEHKNPNPIIVQQNPVLLGGDNLLPRDPLTTEEERGDLAKEGGDNLTEASENAFAIEQPEDKAAEDPAPQETPLKKPTPNFIDNPYQTLKNNLKSKAKEVKLAGKEMMKQGDKKIADAKKMEQDAEKITEQSNKLQKRLNNARDGEKIGIDRDGKHELVNRDKAEKFHADLKQKAQLSQSMSRAARLDGKVNRVFGHGIKKAGKQLGKEIDGAGTACGAAALQMATTELLNGNLISNGELNINTIATIGTESLKSTAWGGAQRVAFEATRGAVKEVLPNVAKKIPGVNTVVGVTQVAQAMWNAETMEEAVGNGVKASFKIGLNLGMQAVCNTLFPVGGIFVAAVATPVAEYMINGMVSNC